MPNRIQLRRGSALEWHNANPLLAEGEICVELDTEKFKIGNGVDYWRDLQYSSGPVGPQGATGPQGSTGTQGVAGPQGIQGNTGTAGTITIGTVAVTTVTTVINVGTPEDAILNFTIQQGPKGDTGTQINKLIDIPDINSADLATGAMLVYDGVSSRWNTDKDLPLSSNIDAGEF